MEQIVKLLFATTLLSIFAYLLIFTSVGQAGNGGEYWGFDGSVQPFVAAGRSFDAGDYRYLEVDLTDPLGNRVRVTPMYWRCDNHPSGSNNGSRPTLREPMHGGDSVRLATDFALEFNNQLNSLMQSELNICCGDCLQLQRVT